MGRAQTQLTESVALEQVSEGNASYMREATVAKHKALHKWSKTQEGGKLLETAKRAPQRALSGAMYLEAQDRSIKGARLREDAVISNNYPVLPMFTRLVARFGGANSNRPLIASEIMLVTPYDNMFYISRERARAVKGATVGEDMYEVSRPLYSTDQIEANIATGDGATVSFPIAGLQTPVRPKHVEVLVNNVKVGQDDGVNGFFTYGGVIDITLSAIDYTAGTGTLVFTVAPVLGAVISLLYAYDIENETAYNTQRGIVRISVGRKEFNATPKAVGFTFHEFANTAVRTTGILDSLRDESISAAGELMAEDMDYGCFRDLGMLARRNPTVSFDAKPSSGGDDNDFNHAQRLPASVSTIGNSIYNQLKRGTANVGVIGMDWLTYAQKHEKFENDDSQERLAGSFLAGRLNGVTLFATATDALSVNGNEAIFLYRGAVETDVPLIYGVMEPFSFSLTTPNAITDGTLYRVDGKVEGTTNFARNHRIDNFQA